MKINLVRILITVTFIFAVLAAPFNSPAQPVPSVPEKSSCGCQLSSVVNDLGDTEKQQELFEDYVPDCCDSQPTSADAAESCESCDSWLTTIARRICIPNPHQHIPEVYLAIFVPPESTTLSYL